MNRIRPTKDMIAITAPTIMNIEGMKVTLGVGLSTFLEIEKIKDKKNRTYDATRTIGMITAIKLAVSPNFLPDSSDMLSLSCYSNVFADKLFG